MSNLRKCDCGGTPATVKSFGNTFVHCDECGAEGKVFSLRAQVNGQWPTDAAEQAWNDRIMEEES